MCAYAIAVRGLHGVLTAAGRTLRGEGDQSHREKLHASSGSGIFC